MPLKSCIHQEWAQICRDLDLQFKVTVLKDTPNLQKIDLSVFSKYNEHNFLLMGQDANY